VCIDVLYGDVSPHSWTILEGENPRILQKIRSPVFQCSRVHDVGRTLVVFPNKSEAFKLTMNAGCFVEETFCMCPFLTTYVVLPHFYYHCTFL
jgi:hypothetical protein